MKLTAPAQLNQTTVSPYDTFDLYTQYELKAIDSLPVTLSLGITNLFNTNPPHYNGVDTNYGSGYANGNTLGRVIQLGANVKF